MKKILIPVDGSKDSLEGIRLFKEMNICANNEIHLLNVQNIIVPYEDFFTIGDKEGLLQYLGAQGESALAEAKEILSGETFVSQVLLGDPVTEILSYAEKIGADLIVVGSHGRTGLNAILMGSVTSKLLSYSSIPVMVTRPAKPKTEAFTGTYVNLEVD